MGATVNDLPDGFVIDSPSRNDLQDQLASAADKATAEKRNPAADPTVRALQTKLYSMPLFGSAQASDLPSGFILDGGTQGGLPPGFKLDTSPEFQHQFGGLKEVAEAAQPIYEQAVDAIRSAAAKPWRIIQNIGEQVFPLPAAVTQYARQAAESLETPTGAPATTLPEKITRGIVGGAAELPAFALSAAAGGPAGLAALGAAEELHRGGYAAAQAAGQNALLGFVNAPLSEFTKPSQAAIYGGYNAAMTAAQGGDLSDVVASAVTGAGLAIPGGAGRKTVSDLLPERSETAANPAAEIRRLRYQPGEGNATDEGQVAQGNRGQYQGTGIDRATAEAGDRNIAESRGEIPPQVEAPRQGTVERRTDTERRAAVADMSPDEMRQALLTDPLTGLPNRRAYVEADKQPITSSIDVDSLKWANDNLGHAAGDQIIKAVGNALQHVEGYHLSGDEFVAQFPDRASAEAGMEQFHKNLANTAIEFKTPAGDIVSMTIGASHGIGESLSDADTALQQNKLSREEAGLRSARGNEPPGLSRQPLRLVGAEGDVTAGGQRISPGGNESANAINPLGHAQGGAIDIEPLARAAATAIEATKPVIRDLQMKVSPMEAGTIQTAGAAKEVANMKRAIDWESNAVVRILTKSFTPDELRVMWDRMSEESVARQQGRNTAGTGTGLDGLTVKQRDTVMELQNRSARVAQQAVELGLLKDPMDIYDPRKFVEVLPDGTKKVLVGGVAGPSGRPISEMAGGARVSSPHLRERKHLTAEESEAAAKAKLGENVELLRDARVLPIVTAQLEHAVVGKRLINQIRAYDGAAGDKTDATISYQPKGDYFTLPENPAFHEYRYAGKNEDGTPNIQRVPIYIHKDFEGPLRAVLENRQPGKVYGGLMALKNANSALVMASPVVHHATIFAKALPFMPGKVATLRAYFEGNKLRQDNGFTRRSIEDGVVYVDSHQFQQEVQNQVPEGLLAVKPGRGLVAKTAALVSPAAARGIDRAGAFWHQTLLWNRIGDLQASLYNTVKSDLMTRGMDAKAAGQVGAHFANRFGGSIPREELSANANKLANISLFSKSFTGTNLGLYLDATRGLPKSTQGVIQKNSGDVARQAANSYVRKQAAATILKDIALLYGVNALTQSAIEKIKGDKSLSELGQGYADRFNTMWNKLNENPAHVLNTPFESLQQLFPQGQNEPGKQNRVLLAKEASGQALYGKLSAGKTGEDLINITSPNQMIHNKMSGLGQFGTQMFANQDAFGKRIWDPEAKGVAGMVGNLGHIATAFMKAQVPTDMAESLWATQHGDERKVTELKTFLPALGVSVSRGSPKGPEGGVISEYMRQHAFQVQQGTKLGMDLIDQGRPQDALKAMQEEGMTQREALMLLKYRNQYGRNTMRNFFGNATPDQIDNFYRLQK